MLPTGSYDVKIVKAGAGADAPAVIEAKDLMVPSGGNLTLAAHLDAAGKPKLTAFKSDTAPTAEGAGLTVRHLAAAPAVDVRAGGKVAVQGPTNPNEATLALAPATVKADVVLAGTDTVAIGPADVDVTKHMNTMVYAWGSAADKNLKLTVQQVAFGGDGMPATGAYGPSEVAEQSVEQTLLMAGGAVTAAAAVLAIAALVTRRRVAGSTVVAEEAPALLELGKQSEEA